MHIEGQRVYFLLLRLSLTLLLLYAAMDGWKLYCNGLLERHCVVAIWPSATGGSTERRRAVKQHLRTSEDEITRYMVLNGEPGGI